MDQWLIVVNPKSGKGKGAKLLDRLDGLLANENIAFETFITTGKDSAILGVKKYIQQGGRKIICVGGDGTLGEVVNGVMQNDNVGSSEIKIALLPNGTGNDWARTWGIPHDAESCLKLIKAGKIKEVDLGRVSFNKGNTVEYRYFINMAGFGFDAAVAREALQTHFMGYRGNTVVYLLALIKTAFFYKKSDAEITINNHSKSFADVFSVCLANGRYHGGGYLQAPEADPSDGLLHATIISEISTWGVFKNIKNLYDGSFVNDPAVTIEKGESFRIESSVPIDVEIDGELLAYPFEEIGIVPKAIQFIIP